jgi:hypothetical protein
MTPPGEGGGAAYVPVAERMALLDLHARLAFAIDSGDAVGWAALFTLDGILRTSRPRELVGREAIAVFAGEWYASMPAQRRHVTWHHHFQRAGGDELHGSCYAAVLRSGEAGVQAEFTAVYTDRFVRSEEEGGGWLLRERDVAIDPSGTP